MPTTQTTPAPVSLPVPVEPSPPPPVPLPAGERLLAAWLSGRAESTVAAYRADLRHFAAFAGTPGPGAAAGLLLARGHGGANALALAYRGAMLQRGLAPATVNRRLASLRSLVQLARTLGLAAFGLDVPSVRAEAYRDTRGPEAPAVRRLLEAAGRRSDRKGLRDRAVLRLLLDLGLRRVEVSRLDRGDVDLEGGAVAVLGKGKREKSRLTLPAPTAEALQAWLAVRQASAGAGPLPPDAPLFVSLGQGGGGRLDGKGVYRVVRALGRAAGIRCWPHALRHHGITRLLDLGVGLRDVQRFSRHADVRVLQRYDDNRADVGGQLARRLAEQY